MAGRQDCARRGPRFTNDLILSTHSSPAGTFGGVLFCTEIRAGGTATTTDMDFSKLDGLIPAVVQDHVNGDVLMVGFMNEEAWNITCRTGYVTFFSRTRNTLWTKGETSGNKLAVRDILIDCDEDTVLVRVKRMGDGNVCHTGRPSCFFRDLPVPRPVR